MGSLIFAYCVAALLVLGPLVGTRRVKRQVATAEDARLRDLRRFAESSWTDYLLGVWAFLTLVGATFALIRGHAIGWGWLGVAALYVLGIVTGRRNRRDLLDALGDRGRAERPDRYKQRAAVSYRFVAVGVTGYIGMHMVDYAYPHDPPTWAEVIYGACGLVMIIGAIGFLAIRASMYLAGDDLEAADTTDQH